MAAPRPATPSQTIGPFFHDALVRADTALSVDPDAGTDAIVFEGRVLDAHGVGVDDALIELWRPSTDRANESSEGHGWARSRTDAGGAYRLTTRPPAALPHPSGMAQAPHVLILVFARGLLDQLLTRAYPLEEGAEVVDPVLEQIPAARRATLLARRDGSVDGHVRYRFDVRLQGPDETVFLEV